MFELTKVLLALVALAGVMVSVFLVPWLKAKTSTAEMAELLTWVEIAVQFSQQLYHTLDGESRLKYALDFLESKGYDVDLPEIRAAIEAEVLKLHQQLTE